VELVDRGLQCSRYVQININILLTLCYRLIIKHLIIFILNLGIEMATMADMHNNRNCWLGYKLYWQATSFRKREEKEEERLVKNNILILN
jgi:hypothetical protein